MTRAVQDTILRQLKEPFDPKFIKWRVGATNADKTKGIALAYIDSREVMKRLDSVMGAGNWQDRYIELNGGLICELDLWIEDRWVTKSNTAGFTNVDPIKGGGSDALKRAASVWGVGRYLYYLPNVWVAIKPMGKSYALAETPELPDWALPNSDVPNWEDVAEMQEDMAGADSPETLILDGLDSVSSATTLDELKAIVADMTAEEQTALVAEINQKTRELVNDKESSQRNTATVPAEK